jgi:NADH-quinone oxidoreductase subunit H
MISYEITLTLSIIGVVIYAQSLSLREIVLRQGDAGWFVVPQFLGFVLFLVAAFAETNRLPFDLPEAESELVAGFHVEYSSMKFALFFMAEYMSMLSASCLMVILFLGGWLPPPLVGPWIEGLLPAFAATYLAPMAWFLLKVSFFMFLFVWVRWTFPRLRYDQLMALGWKVLLPLSIANVLIAGVLRLLRVT